MNTTGCLVRQLSVAGAAAMAAIACGTAFAQPNYAVFLDAYPKGDFNFIEIPDLDDPRVRTVRPEPLRLVLPRKLLRRFQVANGDIHVDPFGQRRIVFGGREGNGGSWDIYIGHLDVEQGAIDDIVQLVAEPGVREEDPRFSWDGNIIVYKCDGRICVADSNGRNVEEVAAKAGCELWAPALDQSGAVVTYVERCGDAASDRVIWHPLRSAGGPVEVPNYDEGPDRFPQFMEDGRILYTHLDPAASRASLWLGYGGTSAVEFHDETESDDDPYVYKLNDFYKAFIGWEGTGYSLYIHLGSVNGKVVRLTDGKTNVLGPILTE